jgi:hypothetical protein
VTATLTVPDGGAEGAVVAQGGRFGGWSVYFRDGRLAYAHNFVGMETYAVRADEALGAGEHTVRVRFDYDGGGPGQGGDVTLFYDDAQAGKGRVDRTVPGLFSFDEGLDVGTDSLDAVVEDYTTPKGTFTGAIDKVVIDIAPDAEHDPDLVLRARYRKQ